MKHENPPQTPGPSGATARQEWLSLLAKSDAAHLAERLAQIGAPPAFEWLRQPEVGGVVVRGRIGGTGAPFNLGEMTVTRCSLRTDDGSVGHGYVQGRGKQHAEHAALIDAMMQGAAAETVEAEVLAPMRAAAQARQSRRAEKAAATKVEFFTLARGED